MGAPARTARRAWSVSRFDCIETRPRIFALSLVLIGWRKTPAGKHLGSMSEKPAWLPTHGDPWKPGAERVAFESGWLTAIDPTPIPPTPKPPPPPLPPFNHLPAAV